MKKFLVIVVLMTASTSAFAEPVFAPSPATWTKIESFESAGQINIEGYIVGSPDLKKQIIMPVGTTQNHCERSLAMMMDKPGKYTLEINYSTCILRAAKS